jgi:hypothetical protein
VHRQWLTFHLAMLRSMLAATKENHNWCWGFNLKVQMSLVYSSQLLCFSISLPLLQCNYFNSLLGLPAQLFPKAQTCPNNFRESGIKKYIACTFYALWKILLDHRGFWDHKITKLLILKTVEWIWYCISSTWFFIKLSVHIIEILHILAHI